MLKKTSTAELVPMYKKFMKDFCGLEMTDAMCKMDLESHPVFTLEEQIKMMNGSPSVVEAWELGVLDFFTSQGKLRREDAGEGCRRGRQAQLHHRQVPEAGGCQVSMS